MRHYLVTAEEMRRYDAYTIEKVGMPAMVLMERAALAARDCVLEQLDKRIGQVGYTSARVLVMAGVGNNGGDGLALARLLAERGIRADVWRVGDEAKASDQWRAQRRILKCYDVECCDNLPEREYTILVDALFGVGLTREITGQYAEAIGAFNGKSGYKLALDLPSGIDSDTGKVMGCAVRADATVTFGFAKRGLYLYPGAGYAGALRIAEIGILADPDRKQGMFCLTSVRGSMPGRDPAGNKGTFGKVLLIAGAQGMSGAAVLAAKAAYRVGAGMVKVLTAPENRVILQETVPEALYGTGESLRQDLEWADVIVIGPGLGREPRAKRVLEQAILESAKPIVIDADGLNLLAEDIALQNAFAAQRRGKILTPHVGELARLLGKRIEELKDRLWEHGMELAEKLDAVVAAKDARTFICREGEDICVNVLGGSGMATAGSGDVLAGAVAGLYGQFLKMDEARGGAGAGEQAAYRAACVGVLIHAAAGDLAAAAKGEHACMAGDIAAALADVRAYDAEQNGHGMCRYERKTI